VEIIEIEDEYAAAAAAAVQSGASMTATALRNIIIVWKACVAVAVFGRSIQKGRSPSNAHHQI